LKLENCHALKEKQSKIKLSHSKKILYLTLARVFSEIAFVSWFEVVILSFVEGVTEYLPISSTGHLIIFSHLFGIAENPSVKSFNIIIQVGAILSVLFLYGRRFLKNNLKFYRNLMFAFIPAALIGVAVKSKIDLILGSVQIVASALLLGGVILLFVEKLFHTKESKLTIEDLSLKQCLLIGVFQCFAFIPGVSRAAATIIGGLSAGLNPKEATEFSFFLAVPTLAGAAFIKSVSAFSEFDFEFLKHCLGGLVLSFFFATLAIKFFIGILTRFGMKPFGYYRIALGGLLWILILTGQL
jgi:undecaprenyl-diphosphatase